MSATMIQNSAYLKFAALGGLAGAIAMAIVMMGATSAAGLGATAMLCAMAAAILGLPPNGSPTSITAGLSLHLIDGIIIGLIVVGITLSVKRGLLIKNAKSGLLVGLLAGFVVWLVFGLPIMLFVMPPSMVDALSMMMPANGMTQAQVMNEAMTMLQGMMGMLAGVFLIGHLFYGAVLGTVVGYGVSRKTGVSQQQYKCEKCGAAFASREELMNHSKQHMKSEQQLKCATCGATFKTQADLMEHGKVHVKSEQQFKCQACGMAFGSQSELMEHAKKAHPMPAG